MKNQNGFQPRTLAKLANLAKQTLEAATLPEKSSLASVTVAEPRKAEPEPPAPAAGPQVPPEGATLSDGMPDPEPGTEDSGNWHGFTRRELLTLAEPGERADLEASPDALAACAFALRLGEIRAHGERPTHYTREALCATCGPVFLFPGEADRVLGCPWCENTAKRRPIPRPLVACADCRHWRPDSINPPSGLGSCTAEAPASKQPGTLWPRGKIACGDWRPA